ncbi:MAG: hypothetical protein WCI73_03185 [Phycisphaerae bacterium]
MIPYRMICAAVLAWGFLACGAAGESRAAEAADRKPAILILNEYNWPPQIVFERSNFQKLLTANGFVCEYTDQPNFVARNHSDLPTVLAKLKQFNLVIVVGAPEYDVANNRVPALSAKLTEALVEYHHLGGGLFFMPTTGGYEGNHAEKTANYLLQPFGAKVLLERVWDLTRTFAPPNQRFFDYFWTEDISKSPVTDGVKCLFLPYRGDHDGAATTAVALDQSWNVVIRGMPEAKSFPQGVTRQFDRNYDLKATGTYAKSPPLMAIKEANGGRLAILPVFPMYTLFNAENPILDDVVWSKGDGYRKSDMKTLLFNTFRWLAEPTLAKSDWGGYVPVTKAERMQMSVGNNLRPFDWSKTTFPAAQKIYQGVVGAHSSLTDGTSTVAQYAAAARQNKLSFIVFTEPLPRMTKEKWETLKSECAQASGPDFQAYAGLEYLDETGATFLEFDMNEFPLPKWITPDGRINDPPGYHFQNGRECAVALCLGDRHKKETRIDPWHHDLYSHTAVYSYDRDQLLDDSTDSYQHGEATDWCNVPIAFTRIHAAADLPKVKMLTCVQADSLPDMIARFSRNKMNHMSFPQPAFISGGPLINVWAGVNLNGVYPTGPGKERYRICLNATSEKGLKEVKIVEATTGEIFRRYLPQGQKEFSQTIDGYHFAQPYLIAYVTDLDGNSAVSSCLTTELQRNHVWSFQDLRNHPTHYAFINEQGWWEQAEATGFGFNRDGNYAGIEVGSKAPVIRSNLEVYGLDGGTPGGFWAHVAPFLTAPGCQEFNGETGDFVFYQGLASTDLQTGRYTSTNVVYGPRTTWGPRARKPSEFLDATITQYGFRPRYQPQITATSVRGDVTFKQDVTLDAKTPLRVLHAHMERFFAKTGDAAQFVVSDQDKGTLAWKMQPQGRFSKRGQLPFGGYVSVYPQILVANTPTVLTLTDQLTYDLYAEGEDVSFNISLAGPGAKTYHAGDHVQYEFVMLQPAQALNTGNEWIEDFKRNFGLSGPLPYQLDVTTGTLQQFKYWLKLAADNGAVRLHIAKTANLPMDIPVSVSGLNANCPAGVYDTQILGFRHIAVDAAGIGYLQLNPNEGTKDLFLGNLITCDQKAAKVSVVSSGQGAADIVVHNPTDTDLKCVLTGQKHFPPLAAFQQEVVVKAGSDMHLPTTLAKEWKYTE